MTEDSPIKENRVGRFFVSTLIIRTAPYAVLIGFMANFFVVRAESMHVRQGIEYDAYSALFDLVDEYEKIPHYDIVTSSSGVLSVRKEG